MAEMTTKIPISSVTKEMVMQVEVTGVKAFGIRLLIAKGLIWLAAKISGMGVRFESATQHTVTDGTYTINTEGMITSAKELRRKLRERLK